MGYQNWGVFPYWSRQQSLGSPFPIDFLAHSCRSTRQTIDALKPQNHKTTKRNVGCHVICPPPPKKQKKLRRLG